MYETQERQQTEDPEGEVWLPVFGGTNRNGSSVRAYRVGKDRFTVLSHHIGFPTVIEDDVTPHRLTFLSESLDSAFDFVEFFPEWERLTGGEA
jgi:hypothetical protein